MHRIWREIPSTCFHNSNNSFDRHRMIPHSVMTACLHSCVAHCDTYVSSIGPSIDLAAWSRRWHHAWCSITAWLNWLCIQSSASRNALDIHRTPCLNKPFIYRLEYSFNTWPNDPITRRTLATTYTESNNVYRFKIGKAITMKTIDRRPMQAADGRSAPLTDQSNLSRASCKLFEFPKEVW